MEGIMKIHDDGTIWKKTKGHSKHMTLFPILKKYELDFFPKILDYNKSGYRYRYVDGTTIKSGLNNGTITLTMSMILEIKMAMDNIWKKFYQISKENLKDGHFFWYNDPNLNNLIWKDDTKKLILLDIDCLNIGNYIPLAYVNNFFYQQLEIHFIRARDHNMKKEIRYWKEKCLK
jgi:hypothetical protein|tara:strand:+ start:286 stop:810 length:525 start_codon:yes stop_codon:yes gene_type:complete